MRRYQGRSHTGTGPGIYLSRGGGGFKLELKDSTPQFKRPTVRQAPTHPSHRAWHIGKPNSGSGSAVRCCTRRPIIYCAIAIEQGPEARTSSCAVIKSLFVFFSFSFSPISCWFLFPLFPFFPSYLFPPRSPRHPFRICRPATRTVSWAGTSQPRNRCEVLLPHRYLLRDLGDNRYLAPCPPPSGTKCSDGDGGCAAGGEQAKGNGRTAKGNRRSNWTLLAAPCLQPPSTPFQD
ncbi:hypothetical protein LZ31DRAFT_346504 [Colletotrichum somersetense]|nr:hypothetical protein LZ31DRAFT_66492 [Colletotrichum somersetense]KAK2042931.1 hypothetical protein LZ31DRAFT_346504 [Colletotrichum somersetense]